MGAMCVPSMHTLLPPPPPPPYPPPTPHCFVLQFLNDLVVDEVNDVAYISDTGAVGGIVVFDRKNNVARRWGSDPTQQADPT